MYTVQFILSLDCIVEVVVTWLTKTDLQEIQKEHKTEKKTNKPIPVPFPMDPMGSRMDAATGTGRRTNLRCLFALGRLRCMDLV